jgi:hypothetical protein
MNDTLREVTRWADRGDRMAIATVIENVELEIMAPRVVCQAPTRRRTTGLTASRLEGTPERMVAEER